MSRSSTISVIFNLSIGLGNIDTIFSPRQEAELVGYLEDLEQIFHGFDGMELRELVYQSAEKNKIEHPFISGVAGCMDFSNETH